MPITLEKARLNLWNVVGFAVGIAVTAFGWGITYNSVVTANAAAAKDIASLRDDVKDIQLQMPQIAQLQFQVTANAQQIAQNKAAADEQIKAANARMDRFVETVGGKMDLMTDSLNKLVTRVEVLSNRVGDNGGNADPKRTRFMLPITKP
ncbi:hypothetical protein EOA32_00870 [Mesorhizobium sp. M1A.F.Ca.ET.072.01.1.1]|uniref:hypothetical protein n=1 Tax=Mesorhizobium sp. M1A.F.Ca.ET.072.01.1.1 TaxID=2496753 RepID=UPI000FD21AC5|nr:hypothetical protein [Mesorhizobium sp. M1A.F.Ca.ET.072.01.1.1]RUW55603.1 hypothetical protein EOA32_00870 [Mesorhizobium sp. M1A.F.Ca.ET.072.01.1.1]